MRNNRLLVVFHSSTNSAVDPDAQERLKAETFKHFPKAAYCSKSGTGYAEMIKGHQIFNGNRLSDAADTIHEHGKNKNANPVLVTLCPLMMEAAARVDIPVVTLGAPPVCEGRQFMASELRYIPNMVYHAAILSR